jgi:GNAT superfamily N-acetyltransferase
VVSDPSVLIRPVRPDDVPAVVAMVHDLADYELAPQHCRLTGDQLRAALFTARPALFGHVAMLPMDDQPVDFALWFLNFSTWEGTHGIYLEDLYVRPAARGLGAGKALLAALAATCLDRGYRRLDWWALHWVAAREFYRGLGATALEDWVPYRLEGDALRALAGAAALPDAGSVGPGRAEPNQ